MTSALAKNWLFRLLGKDEEELSKEPAVWRVYRILEDVMSSKATAKDSANRTASLVASKPEAWYDVIGISLASVEMIADEVALEALVNYFVELASLPDAINESREAFVVDHVGYAGASVRIEPGEPLAIGEGGKRLWRDLPHWSLGLADRFQGPELWLTHPYSASPDSAKTSWTNLNTFLALLAANGGAQTIPVLAGWIRTGCATLSLALESPPETQVGKNVELHLPAAAAWFRIAGDELEKLCKDETRKLNPRELWASQGGGKVCDSARLGFWKKRMSELIDKGTGQAI